MEMLKQKVSKVRSRVCLSCCYFCTQLVSPFLCAVGMFCLFFSGYIVIYSYLLSDMIEWLNGQLPNLNVSVGSSLEDLRVCLLDGTVLCQILNRLYPGAVEMVP